MKIQSESQPGSNADAVSDKDWHSTATDNSTAPVSAAKKPESRQPMGWVYLWHNRSNIAADTKAELTGSESSSLESSAPGWITKSEVCLQRLNSPDRLDGRYVQVRNVAVIKHPKNSSRQAVALGDALPDPDGNFCFEPHRGGGRMERHAFAEPEMWERYISASRFGEVNAYFHTDRVAAYVDSLLNELGYPLLPKVIVHVNAHNAIAEVDGQIDGVLGKVLGKVKTAEAWYPMQGGHYRLATRKKLTVRELLPVSPTGEIHLGPGWKLAYHGALAERVGEAYRCNASHNAGTIYHEYGHHVARHTADFRANGLRDQQNQCNYKTDVDEAICDYLAATMMNSPHIWALHHQHNSNKTHRRSLVSQKTNDDYVRSKEGMLSDAHDNGTILAATLWDLRTRLITEASSDPQSIEQAIRHMDLMVMHSLILIGRIKDHPTSPTIEGTCRLRKGFGTVRQVILQSSRQLFSGRYETAIRQCFRQRKIVSRNRELLARLWSAQADQVSLVSEAQSRIERIKSKCRPETIPSTAEILTASQLNAKLQQHQLGPYSLIAVGDVMVGSRARKRTNEFGWDYIFHSTEPLFRRSAIVLANQEGPIARRAQKLPRNHSYKVSPKYTTVLTRAGFNVLTLANNHLLDCGREGVLESLKYLKKHGIHAIGIGRREKDAHQPAIVQAGEHTVGLLGYYWNRRTAARGKRPGSAMDTPEALAQDIARLRPLVDRVVVTVHWGVPYDREPSITDQEKARLMISLGADIVIGHHPHIIQKVEVFQNRPIFYSVGNFAFGTGNSHAESMVLGVDFQPDQTVIDMFPAYVRNRDPRINYQPKIMTGEISVRVLEHLKSLSTEGQKIQINDGIGRLSVPYLG